MYWLSKIEKDPFLLFKVLFACVCILYELELLAAKTTPEYTFIWHIKCVQLGLGVMVLMFKATFINISVISWRSILLVEETRVPGENPPTWRKSLTKLSLSLSLSLSH